MAEFNAIKKERVTVEISEREINDFVIRKLKLKYGIGQHDYLENGNIMRTEHTSHAFESVVGKATERQKFAFELIGHINALFSDKD